jgi:hypothetical protein
VWLEGVGHAGFLLRGAALERVVGAVEAVCRCEVAVSAPATTDVKHVVHDVGDGPGSLVESALAAGTPRSRRASSRRRPLGQ